MGFMDNFTSDSPVTVKQPDYYEMVKEAAKAELITNAVNAEVPGYHIQAMITGKSRIFLIPWMQRKRKPDLERNMNR